RRRIDGKSRGGDRAGRSARSLLAHVQHLRHGEGQLAPGARFGLELFAAATSELVIFSASIVLGGSPTRLDPAAAFEAVESGIQRPLLNCEHVLGNLLDAFRDGPAMLRAEGDGLENE